MKPVHIGPSILTADLLDLGVELASAEAAGVDFIHYDVMDGRFVPNISFGFPVLEAMRRGTSLPIDVHLMIVEPEKYLERFFESGATSITVHAEACPHLHATLGRIREIGANAGVSLNPATPVAMIEDVLDVLDQVLVMSVNPGFGGQSFIPAAIERIERIRTMMNDAHSTARLAVDGGIKPDNAGAVVRAGADMLIAGSALFNESEDVADAVGRFRSEIDSVKKNTPIQSQERD